MKLIVILATALCVTLVGSSPLSVRDRLQSEVSRLKNVHQMSSKASFSFVCDNVRQFHRHIRNPVPARPSNDLSI